MILDVLQHLARSFVVAVAFALIIVDASGNGMLETSWANRDTLYRTTQARIHTDIKDQLATTTLVFQYDIRHTVPVHVRFGMTVASAMTVTSVRYAIDGEWHNLVLQRVDTAAHGPVGGQSDGTNLDYWIGTDGFIVSLADSLLGAHTLEFEVVGVEVLRYLDGRLDFDLPLTLAFYYSPRNTWWSFSAAITFPVRDVRVACRNGQPVVTDTSISMAPTFVDDGRIGVSMEVRLYDLHTRLLSFKRANEDGYAVLIGMASHADDYWVRARRITLMLDRSESAARSYLWLIKPAASACLTRLRAGDEVNVMRFAHWTETLYGAPVPWSPLASEQCQRYIDMTKEDYGTDITRSLRAVLRSQPDTTFENIIVLITDGQTSIDFDAIRAANPHGARILVIGIGDRVNEIGLRRLAAEHRGGYISLTERYEIEARLPMLFRCLGQPLVAEPAVELSPALLVDILPHEVAPLHLGEAFVYSGRYMQGGDVRIRISGTGAFGSFERSATGTLVDSDGGDPVVPKIWARMRIDAVVELMRAEPSGTSRWMEWRDEVIRLGLAFGLLTPFTTFVDGVRAGGDVTDVVEALPRPHVTELSIAPNPAYRRAIIRFEPTFALQNARIDILGMDGRSVECGVIDRIDPGSWMHEIELVDASGAPLPPGVYVVIVRAGTFSRTARIVVLRN